MSTSRIPRPVTYKRNYLDRVILRFDFDQVDLNKLGIFSKKIATFFPLQEKTDGATGQVKIDIEKGKMLDNSVLSFREWKYLSANRKKKLTITSQFIALTYLDQSYKNKEDLLKTYEQVIAPFFTQFQITSLNKIGLRYVNNINLNFIKKDFKWTTYIKQDLLGGIDVAKRAKGDIARSMNQIEIRYPDENLKFVYGIWNVDYPSENTRKEFIIDIDCQSRFPLGPGEEVKESVEKYNKYIEDIFEGSITPQFRKILQTKK